MITTEQAEAEPREYLGRDIAMAENDIKFGPQNNFSFVSFEDNLGQAIKNRLQTQVNELILHPDYGATLPDLVQLPKRENTLFKIRESVRAALLQEPRIDSITRLDVVDNNGVFQVDLEVKPINTKDNFNLIFDLFQ